MTTVCIIDTTVFLNLLNVPSRNQDIDKVANDYREYVQLGATFILPMAAIIETGNHIAQNGNGFVRRETAKRFCDTVKEAFKGDNPFRPSEFPNNKDVLDWLDLFPELAGRNKSPTKTTEGTSFGDLSIIGEFEKCKNKFSKQEIIIWSLDRDLNQYHHLPTP